MNANALPHFNDARIARLPACAPGSKPALPWVGLPIEEADRPHAIAPGTFELRLAA